MYHTKLLEQSSERLVREMGETNELGSHGQREVYKYKDIRYYGDDLCNLTIRWAVKNGEIDVSTQLIHHSIHDDGDQAPSVKDIKDQLLQFIEGELKEAVSLICEDFALWHRQERECRLERAKAIRDDMDREASMEIDYPDLDEYSK